MTAPTNARMTVLDALPYDANQGLTAREISDNTGVKYATVTEHLRSLADGGQARKEKSGRQITWTRVPGEEAQRPAATRDASATGAVVVDEVADASGPVPVRDDAAPSETAVDASDALGVADTTPDAGSAATGDVDPADGPTAAVVDLNAASSIADVAGFMEAARPIPDAPAQTEKAPRTRSANAASREVRNDFGSGGLQGEMLRYMDETRDENGNYKVFGPYDLATALKAHASSVSYSLKRTTAKGQTIQVNAPGEKPRFRLATADEAAAFEKAKADAAAQKAAAPAAS